MCNTLNFDKRIFGRLITTIENDEASLDDLKDKYDFLNFNNSSLVIGITGPPGVGKSTLLNHIIKEFRKTGKKVGVIAVDPSSVLTGGAFLGDRIRMQRNAVDPGVFIRSMATRGYLGGISAKTREIVDLFKSAGFDRIIIETVGVGQTEVEVVKVADLVIGVTSPAQGDEIQMMKAGIFEISDIVVLNKCDYKGSEIIYKDLVSTVSGISKLKNWEVPVIKMIAIDRDGIEYLMLNIDKFYKIYQKERK